jgi:alpha-ketoglutarate-dependent taurine dioxygenase
MQHPASGERFFFNQAHLFHLSALGGAASAMLRQFGANRLPRHAFFGDGGEIAAADLEAVRLAFKAEALAFPWQAGDVVLVDNLQAAHGRRPFRGQRKVIVSLMEGRITPPEALRLVAERSVR